MNEKKPEEIIPHIIQYSSIIAEISCHVEHLHERATPFVQAGANIDVDLG